MHNLEFQSGELARKIAKGYISNNVDEYLDFVKELEHQIGDMTFTVPLYRYLKKGMEKE